jgi:hypothetical protein
MKGLFPQYSYSDTEGYAEVWKSALFVFDTNVLLNLYRYQTNTREELLSVLEKLADRIWIPHHVALEFQRNRISVIAEQGRRFNDIRQVVEKIQTSLITEISNLNLQKRHALINPEPLVSGFEKIAKGFLKELDNLEKNQQPINSKDLLQQKIEEIFENKVGSPYTAKEIEELNKDAEKRYKSKIPPGYKDKPKEKDEQEEFQHEDVIYKKKYGDFIVWKQLLDYASTYDSKKLIFVTDDGKEDWWAQASGKTLGPRAELREEASRIGKLDSFLMYKPDGFLRYAKEFLKADISDETLSEVRDISQENKNKESAFQQSNTNEMGVLHSVMSWILQNHARVKRTFTSFPDFIALDSDKKHAYDIQTFNPDDYRFYRRTFRKLLNEPNLSTFDTVNIVYIAGNIDHAMKIMELIQKAIVSNMQDNLKFTIGTMDISDSTYKFSPIFEAKYVDLK